MKRYTVTYGTINNMDTTEIYADNEEEAIDTGMQLAREDFENEVCVLAEEVEEGGDTYV